MSNRPIVANEISGSIQDVYWRPLGGKKFLPPKREPQDTSCALWMLSDQDVTPGTAAVVSLTEDEA